VFPLLPVRREDAVAKSVFQRLAGVGPPFSCNGLRPNSQWSKRGYADFPELEIFELSSQNGLDIPWVAREKNPVAQDVRVIRIDCLVHAQRYIVEYASDVLEDLILAVCP
jgi:hypothetical protein